MSDNPQIRFDGGPNIAIKVPPPQWEATVAFYRDTLGLEVIGSSDDSVSFRFGANRLWIDRVASTSHAEVWLEVVTADIDTAADHLAREGVVRRDEIEPLPAGLAAFWIASPASVIHLVDASGGSDDQP